MSTEVTEIAPLDWPDCWKRQSNLDRFLMHMPLLGPDRRTMRSLRRQLKTRDWRALRAWGSDPLLTSVASELHTIIREELEWPNDRFVPKDRCEILLFDPTMQLRRVQALVCIEQVFDLPDGFLDAIDRQTVGELAASIAELERRKT
jgi:hypothetical protein